MVTTPQLGRNTSMFCLSRNPFSHPKATHCLLLLLFFVYSVTADPAVTVNLSGDFENTEVTLTQDGVTKNLLENRQEQNKYDPCHANVPPPKEVCGFPSEAVDVIPHNPGVSPSLSSHISKYGKDNIWSTRDQFGDKNGSMKIDFPDANDPSSARITHDSGVDKSNVWWTILDESLPPLLKGVSYRISFKVKLDPSIRMHTAHAAFFINPKYKSNYDLPPNTFTAEPQRWLSVIQITDIKSSSEPGYSTLTAYLRVTQDYYSSHWAWNKDMTAENPPVTNLNTRYVALALRFEQQVATGFNAATFFIKDLTVTQPKIKFPTPTQFYSSESELFQPRKPSYELDPNPRGSICPWNQPNLKLWHDPATWPDGKVPDPSTPLITIPENTSVLITNCIPGNYDASKGGSPIVYKKWMILTGSEVIFADQNINLHIENIEINGGKFRIGSEFCRLYSKISLTFHGNRTKDDNLGAFLGSKGISNSNGGSLLIHGKQFHYTWSRLSTPAHAGHDRIYLQDPVNWEVGQEIVIATSFYQDDWWDQNELKIIKGIDSTKKIIQLTEPLNYYHYSGNEYQTEVGLLSRRIQVIGNKEDSEISGFGGHLITYGSSIVQLSGVQAIHMGQLNTMARYPFHMHVLRDYGVHSYFKDLSCKNTFFRCVTVHGTNNTLVSRLVSYKTSGNTFYLEDGVEENNTFSYNLAIHTQVVSTPASGDPFNGETITANEKILVPTDAAASSFYITNAYNIFIGNAASGGWTGFGFPNLYSPTGFFKLTPFLDPSSKTNLIFDGNTAHSSGYYWASGSCIYTGGSLQYLPNSSTLQYISGRETRNTRIQNSDEIYDVNSNSWNVTDSTPLWMRLNNTKLWLCNTGVNHWGDRVEVVSFEIHDTLRAASLAGESFISDGIINGLSSNPISGLPDHQGFSFYPSFSKNILTNTNFRNYKFDNEFDTPRNSFCFKTISDSDFLKPQGNSATKNISFTNVDRNMTLHFIKEDTGAATYFNYIDYDGTSTYDNSPTIVGSNSNWWKFSNDCLFEWNVWRCAKFPGMEIANIQILIPGLIDSSLPLPPSGSCNAVGKTYLWGDNMNELRSAKLTSVPGVTGITGRGWFLFLQPDLISISPKLFSINTVLIPLNTFIIFAVNYPSDTTFDISNQLDGNFTRNLSSVDNLDSLKSSDGSKYFWDGHTLFLKLVNGAISNPETNYPCFERDGVKIYSTDTRWTYTIKASCDTVSTINGYDFCASTETVPSAALL